MAAEAGTAASVAAASATTEDPAIAMLKNDRLDMCADLRRSAEEYNGTRNITMVISELENHMAAVAGLFPTWDLPKEQHLVGAHAAISKLAMGTCFGQQSGI